MVEANVGKIFYNRNEAVRMARNVDKIQKGSCSGKGTERNITEVKSAVGYTPKGLIVAAFAGACFLGTPSVMAMDVTPDAAGTGLGNLNRTVTDEERNFNFTSASEIYTVAEDLGNSTAGTINVNGVVAGAAKSVIDLNGHSGFDMRGNTVLNISNVEIKNAFATSFGAATKIINGSVDIHPTISLTNVDFTGNVSQSSTVHVAGGAVTNYVSENGATINIDRISGNYTNNGAIGKGEKQGMGGAICNFIDTTTTTETIHINSISGNFTGNYATSEGGNTFGGAIDNNGGIINGITGSFIDNYVTSTSGGSQGGAIFNSKDAKITTINSDFSGNYALSESDKTLGGAIFNEGTIISLIGTFVDNYVISSEAYSQGGAVFSNNYIVSISGSYSRNYARGSNAVGGAIAATKIDNITADFTDNYVEAISNKARGGAIGNFGTIGKVDASGAATGGITGNFVTNHAYNADGNALGGAVYNNGTITYINAKDATGFKGNYAQSVTANAMGGAIYNETGKTIDSIAANFTENSAKASIWAQGGAIYNGGTSTSISGTFNKNYVKGETIDGGAIYNAGEITNIKGTFSGNYGVASNTAYGGAIFNTNGATINSITGSFIDNYVKGDTISHGGAIGSAAGTIINLSGSFTGNYARGGDAMAGAIVSGTGCSVENITADFTNNYVESTSSRARGGAIGNFGTIGKVDASGAATGGITGNFVTNHAYMADGNALGGAVFNYDTITYINAKDATGFKGNYAQSGTANAMGGAIYNETKTINSINSNFTNNYAQSTSGTAYGGAIYNSGTISNIAGDFSGNYATGGTSRGGAIYNGGTITKIKDSIFTGNNTARQGGAIYNAGTIDNLTNVQYKDNSISDVLGGFINNAGTIGVLDAVVTNNTNTTSNSAIHSALIYNTGTITNITGDYSGNTVSAGIGTGADDGLIISSSGNIGTIDATFSNNKIVTTGTRSNPNGTIYLFGGHVNNIKGSFINNSMSSGVAEASHGVSGGAIYSNGSGVIVDSIDALFRGNSVTNTGSTLAKGGAIGNYAGKFTLINGTFESNYAQTNSGKAYGGAIANWTGATISAIGTADKAANFTGNYAYGSTGDAYGGAIANYTVAEGSTAKIDSIEGNFTNNHVEAGGNQAYGGAIYNAGTIGTTDASGSVTSGLVGNFTGNYAKANSGNVLGGAIYNAGTITSITAADENGFSGNYTDTNLATAIARGGAIYNGGPSAIIGDIISNFTNNHANGENRGADGGAIFNNAWDGENWVAQIGDITGNFKNNSATGMTARGGAIFNTGNSKYENNKASIGMIKGNFEQNYTSATTGGSTGGAIRNEGTATIAGINGNFTGNYATSDSGKSTGGAIFNGGSVTIGTTDADGTVLTGITGNFVNNYAQSSKVATSDDTLGALGGAIYNSGTITSIAAVDTTGFSGNYVQTRAADALGGAIYNTGTIGEIVGSLTNNHATSISGVAQGGAIYSTTAFTLLADNNTINVQGNYTDSNGVRDDNAIYIDSDKATLTLKQLNNGQMVIDDNIDGAEGYKVVITGDNSGKLTLNNEIRNSDVTLSDTTLHLGVTDSDNNQSDVLKTSTLTVTSTPIATVADTGTPAGGRTTVDTVDGQYVNYTIDTLTSSEDARYSIDMVLSKDEQKADTFTLTNGGSGVVYLSSVNITNNCNDNQHLILQIIKSQTGSAPELKYDESKVLNWATANMSNTDILAADFGLATTKTYHDSIEIRGLMDTLAEWIEFDTTEAKTFTFDNTANYVLSRDINAVNGSNLTITGQGNTLDLNNKHWIEEVKQDQTVTISNLIINNPASKDITNAGTLNLNDITLQGNIINNHIVAITGNTTLEKLTNNKTLTYTGETDEKLTVNVFTNSQDATATITGNLNITSTTTESVNNGELTVSGNLTAQGAIKNTKTMTVEGVVSGDKFNNNGSAELGSLTASDIRNYDSLTVTGAVSGVFFTNEGTAELGSLTATGDIYNAKSLTVHGDVSGKNVTTDGTATIEGSLTATGNISNHYDSSLTVGGVVSGVGFTNSGTAELGSLAATGDIYNAKKLTVHGDVSGKNVKTDGTATIEGSLTAQGIVNVGNNGTLTISDALNATSQIINYGNLIVEGAVSGYNFNNYGSAELGSLTTTGRIINDGNYLIVEGDVSCSDFITYNEAELGSLTATGEIVNSSSSMLTVTGAVSGVIFANFGEAELGSLTATGDISNTKKLTVHGDVSGVDFTNSGTANLDSTLTATGNISNTNSLTVTGAVSGVDFENDGHGTANLGSSLTATGNISNLSYSSLTVGGAVSGVGFTNVGTAELGSLTATGDIYNAIILTVHGDVSGKNVKNYGRATIEGTLTATEKVENNGTLTANGLTSGKTLQNTDTANFKGGLTITESFDNSSTINVNNTVNLAHGSNTGTINAVNSTFNLNGDMTGNTASSKFNLTNSTLETNSNIQNQTVTAKQSTLNLGDNGNIFETSSLNITHDSKVNTVDGKYTDYKIKSLTSENTKYAVDIFLSRDSQQSDTFTLAEASSGKIFLSTINVGTNVIFDNLEDNELYILQIIKSATDEAPELDYDESKVLSQVSENASNDQIIAKEFGLCTTTTKNDSLEIRGAQDILAVWTEFETDKDKTFTFVDESKYVLSRDVEDIGGTKHTIDGNNSILDLNNKDYMNTISSDKDVTISNLTIQNAKTGTDVDGGKLTLNTVTTDRDFSAENSGQINITGDTTLGNISASENGTITADDGTLKVAGITNTTGGNITSGGNVIASGSVNNSSTIDIAGNLSAKDLSNDGTLNVGKNLVAEADITNSTGGIATIAGSLTAQGNVQNNGTLSVDENFAATGNLTTTDKLTVKGSTTSKDFTNEGSAELGSLTASGNISSTDELTVHGNVSGKNVTTGGTATVEGSLSAQGNIENNGTLSVTKDLSAGGDITNTQNLTVEGNAFATNFTSNNSATISGNLIVENNITSKDLTVKGSVIAKNVSNEESLTVEGGLISDTVKNANVINVIGDTSVKYLINNGTVNLNKSTARIENITSDTTADFVLTETKLNTQGKIENQNIVANDNSVLNVSNPYNYINDSLTLNTGSTVNLGDLNLNPLHFNSLKLNNGTVNINSSDVELTTKTMGKITADEYTQAGADTVVNLNGIKITDVPDYSLRKIDVPFADMSFAKSVQYNGQKTVYSPIYAYGVSYNDNNGNMEFARGGHINPSTGNIDYPSNPSDSFNPAVLSSPIAVQAGAKSAMLNSFNYAFQHSDNFMALPASQRLAVKNSNKYALAENINGVSPLFTEPYEGSTWYKPFAAFENVPLKNGPKVTSNSYGSFAGFDSNLTEMANGWSRVWTGYVGYNGASLHYRGVDSIQNGGTLGATLTLYKGNLFNATTIGTGASIADTNTMYGHDNQTMLMAGAANKTGYNFEFKNGRFIVQPSMMVSYTFVNSFDYTNAAGVRISSDPLNSIQLTPGLKIMANTKNGWQPYVGINMVWNIMDDTKFTANNINLPDMSIKPYVQYGLGVQKRFKDNFMAFGQFMIQNGGRNGISMNAGLRWAIGKEGKPIEKVNVPQNKVTQKTNASNHIPEQNINLPQNTNVKPVSVSKPVLNERKVIKQLAPQEKKILSGKNTTTITSNIGVLK